MLECLFYKAEYNSIFIPRDDRKILSLLWYLNLYYFCYFIKVNAVVIRNHSLVRFYSTNLIFEYG